jgi:catechol 2,3-dioxygenase-like lactoylglutathione lyase family enzyme
MKMQLEHTGLVVQDLEKELAFYRDVIGLRVIRQAEVTAPPGGDHTQLDGVRRKLVFLGNDDNRHQLELILYINPVSPPGAPLAHHQINSVHLCFKTENLQSYYENLLRHGARFLSPPKLIDRPERGDHVWLCYAQDPEGNWIEFKEEMTAKY